MEYGMKMNLPNKLTILRTVMIPFFILFLYTDWFHGYDKIIAAVIFIAASLTDMLDGQIARRMNIVTDFGKLMDPIADKILSAPIATLITISREFVISGFRLIYANKNIVIAAGPLGKLKTLTQFIGITLMLFLNPVFVKCGVPVDQIIIWISVALAIWSCIDYIVKTNRAAKAA